MTPNETDNNETNLTYSQLTAYYNDLVLQLKLAEHNFKVAIDSEIKKANRNESSEKESKIIKMLNDNILPALEFMVSPD